ncbi:phage tail protein [Mesorhizobium sp. CAU 1741]|uniref:phage tail protein n=1 Tax=Mesorhizobium sp. CAU 1741 TaxID=3140366 RepID=UPI00325B2D57
MVKTPRTRHSKSSREPVTIDLTPGEVSRRKAEAEASDAPSPVSAGAGTVADAVEDAKAAEVTAETKPETADAAEPKRSDSKTSVPTGTGTASAERQASRDSASTPSSDTPRTGASATASSSSQTFGRKESASSTPPPVAPERRSSGSGLLAGVAGGAIALLVAGGLYYSGALPNQGGDDVLQSDPGPAIAALESEIAALREEIAEATTPSAGDPDMQGRLSETEQSVSSFADELYSLREDVQQLGAQSGTEGASVDLAPLEDRITTLSDELDAAREAQTAASSRLDAIEETIATLSGRVDEAADQPATALIIAASALKAAIDRGMPFTTELETYLSLAPDAAQVAELNEMAADGVPTRTEIAAESDAAANAMIAAGRTEDPDAGILDRLTSSAMGLVQVRPVGMVEGEDVPAITARLDAAIQAGDYERAVTEYETLPDDAKAAGAAFMDKVRARLAADGLVDQALSTALQN